MSERGGGSGSRADRTWFDVAPDGREDGGGVDVIDSKNQLRWCDALEVPRHKEREPKTEKKRGEEERRGREKREFEREDEREE
jgi:hypothetical protein